MRSIKTMRKWWRIAIIGCMQVQCIHSDVIWIILVHRMSAGSSLTPAWFTKCFDQSKVANKYFVHIGELEKKLINQLLYMTDSIYLVNLFQAFYGSWNISSFRMGVSKREYLQMWLLPLFKFCTFDQHSLCTIFIRNQTI